MLTMLVSSQAFAYQYGYPSPYGYPPANVYHPAYAPPPYPYYPAYRYPGPPEYARPKSTERKPVVNTPARLGEQVPAESAAVSGADDAGEQNTGLNGRKQAFIDKLLPHIEQENRRLAALRKRVASLSSKLENEIELTSAEQQQLAKLASRYRVRGNPVDQPQARDELLTKIDIIPASLALAQAANESAWGESRFAREANNLFGIWTYDEDNGLKPLRREKGKTHLVRIFDDVGESVRYYMYTLNSHPAYGKLRGIRQQLREGNKDIDGHKLAAGLEKYSAKGQAYIELIQALIKKNQWAQLDSGNWRA